MRHARPLAIGLNCALGAIEIRPYVAELSRLADCFVSTHPNNGLPNEFGEYDDTPDQFAAVLAEFAASGLVNLVGGLLWHHAGAHRGAGARGQGSRAAHRGANRRPAMRLSGLEPLIITEDSLFVNVGERTNITGSARFQDADQER